VLLVKLLEAALAVFGGVKVTSMLDAIDMTLEGLLDREEVVGREEAPGTPSLDDVGGPGLEL